MGRRYMKCPECNRFGVHVKFSLGEDCYRCKYCPFYAFVGGNNDADVRGRQALLDTNPHMTGHIAVHVV